MPTPGPWIQQEPAWSDCEVDYITDAWARSVSIPDPQTADYTAIYESMVEDASGTWASVAGASETYYDAPAYPFMNVDANWHFPFPTGSAPPYVSGFSMRLARTEFTADTSLTELPPITPWNPGGYEIEFEAEAGVLTGLYRYTIPWSQSAPAYFALRWDDVTGHVGSAYPAGRPWTAFAGQTHQAGGGVVNDVTIEGADAITLMTMMDQVANLELPGTLTYNARLMRDFYYNVVPATAKAQYLPPRYRFIYPEDPPRGQWLARQTSNPGGNGGGWPTRCYPNGGTSGGWPHRHSQIAR